MTYPLPDLPDGPRILGHAIGHACALYGGRVDDYADILGPALRGRHRAPVSRRSLLSAYAVGRARQLAAQADDLPPDLAAYAEWIGAAAEILRELTRDA